jgi:uncharacterized protein YaiL (DUF2058 family)
VAKSLQEQLLKAGLINKAVAKTIKTNKRKQIKAQHQHKVAITDDLKNSLVKTKNEQDKKDRLLNLQKQQQAEQKAITAQIKQLIDSKKIPLDKEGEAYNFNDGTSIKKIYISAEVREQIANGRLAIVKIEDRYEVITAEIASKIFQRDEKCILLLNNKMSNRLNENNAYADYQVPDDLIW